MKFFINIIMAILCVKLIFSIIGGFIMHDTDVLKWAFRIILLIPLSTWLFVIISNKYKQDKELDEQENKEDCYE